MKSIMISRIVLLLAWSTLASAGGLHTPLSAAGDDNDCALYLAGPGRTSAFDYSLNLLRGNFGYEGQHTCITYDAVNQAYLEARKRILVSQPKGDWKAEDYASVGELILDISINLARTYGLTYEEIEKGLPLIDTSRTFIREVCPPIFSHVECRAGKYRRMDGLCNNIQNPTWGATMAPFQRLIGPLFADGINAPRIGHTGRDLPLSRVVSRTMHPDEGFHDHAGTVMVIAWGQFMDHDYTLTGTPLDPINRNDPEECCKRPPHLKHPYCNEIRIPDDDYFYRLFGVKCIDFVRGFPSPRPGCRLGSRIPFNTLTGSIDGNTVYGVTEKFARKLRTGYGGLLRMNPVFKEYGLKDLLPLKLDIPDEGCTRPNKNMYCFEAGEIRVNEQLVLTVMHTLMAREHNRIAKALTAVNPHWDDETLFQEARRITIAEIQHITYNEFLPILLGKDVMEKFGLLLEKDGYWDGYDETINPDVIAGFAAAAYRFGHSLLPTAVERWSKAHKFIASKRLSDLIRRPYDLYRAGVLDEYVMGLMNQVAQAMDDSITQEVTNHLFKKVGARFGMDLVSFNMQRGREFGLPGYMEYRKFCGLSGANTFQDLFGSMPNETVRKYESIFEHPIDVDLWSGGVSERPLPGSMLGPTFACVIATQFSYSRRGDRFWFELPNQPSSFTPEQLVEIRKARLARVICDNTDIIDTVQLYPMVLPDHELNPRVPCRSGVIPSMDFSKWAEPAPIHGSAAGRFMTEAEATQNCTNQNATQNITFENTTNTSNDVVNRNKKTDSNDTLTVFLNQKLNTDKLNNSTNNIKCTNEACIEKHDDHSDAVVTTNDKNSNNSVLNYLYKNEKVNTLQKPYGHIRNSLKRKKRANNSSSQELASQSLPVIVNYETTHYPRDREPLQRQVLRRPDLADFNIETSHRKKLSSNANAKDRRDNSYNSPLKQSKESSDEYNTEYNKNKDEIFYNKNDKSEERDKPDVFYSKNNEDSNERYKIRNDPLMIPKSNESFEKEQYKEKSNLQFGTGDKIEKKLDYHDKRNRYRNNEDVAETSPNKRNYKNSDESLEKERYRGDSYERNHQTSDESPGREEYTNDPISKKKYESDESTETNKYRNDPALKKYRNNDESTEKEQYRGDPAIKNYHNRDENKETEKYRNDPYVKTYANSDESNEKEQYTRDSHEKNYHNSDESIEKENLRRDQVNNRHNSDESIEKRHHRGNYAKNRHHSDESIENEHHRRDHPVQNRYDSDERTGKKELRNDAPIKNRFNSDESIEKEQYQKDSRLRNYKNSDDRPENENHKKDLIEKIYPNSDESTERVQYRKESNNKSSYENDKSTEKDQYRKDSATINTHSSDESIEREQHKDKSKEQYRDTSYDKSDEHSDESSGQRNYKANVPHDDEGKQDYKNTFDTRTHNEHRRASPYNANYTKRHENNEENNEKEQINEKHIDKFKNSYDNNEKKLGYNRDLPYKQNSRYDSRHITRENDSSAENRESEHLKEKGNSGDKEYFGNNDELLNKNIDSNDKEKSTYIKQYPADFNLKNYYGANTNEDKLLKNNDIVEKLPLQHSITSNLHNIEINENIQRLNTSQSPTAIQDVDLGDFSYEKIKVNKKGEVELLKDTDPSLEVLPTSRPEKYTENSPLLNSDEVSSNYDESKPLIHINDGEIKPVVEINTEIDSAELSNEDKTELILKEKLNIDNSKEALINVKNQKKDEKNNGNVKQQFERIPLNYNHDNKEVKEKETEVVSEAPPVTVQTDIISGTFEAAEEPPINHRFDEHLNIKFDIDPIKLPEIKLPEDILAYTYEEPTYKKDEDQKTNYYDKNKDKNYYQNADEDHEPDPYRENQKKKNEDEENNQYNDDAYYSYNGPDDDKQNYQKSKDDQEEPDEDSDDVDLYEKFVRERFGKRNSFDKRSEKLQIDKDLPYNPKLQETIKSILKKTEATQKEADKSGDPNAGYLWTLEYGENL